MLDETRPKLIGARVKRVEDPRLLTGTGFFTDDHLPESTLHLALLRSDHAHATIGAIDLDAARAMPGVVAVFTAADLAASVRPMQAPSRMKDYRMTTMTVLADRKVRHVGEPVVAVVAIDRYLAEDAVRAIDVQYEDLPAAVDPEAALAADAPLLHEQLGTNVILAREFTRGEVDTTFAAAPVVVGGRFRFRRKTALPIETRACLAEIDRRTRTLTLHSATQVPGIVRDALAELLDLPASTLRVIAPDVGGGFGSKTTVYAEEVLVCALARTLNRPIKYTSDRLEDLVSTTQSFDEIVDAKLALDQDGTILALSADVIGDIGAYSIYPWTATLEPVQVVSFLPGPYRVPAYRGRVRGVSTPKVPMGPYRGVGRPPSTFVMERLIDMGARKLGIDPADLRERNLVREDEFPYRAPSGLIWDKSAFLPCLRLARDKLNYDSLRGWQQQARASGRWIGIGVASYAELTGIGSKIPAAPGMPVNTGTETATIRIDASGAVTAIFGTASHGQGLETTLAQIVAEELGVRFEDVRVIQGDTSDRTYSTGSYASRSAVLAGGAATLSARAVREQLLRAASHFLEAATEDLDIAHSRVVVRGTDKAISVRDIARRVYIDFGRNPKELQQELEATKLYDPFVGTTSSATHIAVVEIDPTTYHVQVLRYVVAEDCGRIINPLVVDGQVHGGVAQGIGAALLEEIVYNEAGQLLTGSLLDYLAPSAPEVPKMDVLHAQSESPSTLGGYRGMGEGGTIGAPAAIANAVSDALAPLGLEVMELPITPDRIFRMLRSRRDASTPPA